MSRGTIALVSFASGEHRTMTLRELCGWARAHEARVRTDDGWPVTNGKILSLGTDYQSTGVVVDPERNVTLATWQILSLERRALAVQEQRRAQAERHEQQRAEREFLIRS